MELSLDPHDLSLASGDVVRARLRVSGHGPKCLLLHGNPGSLKDWRLVLKGLQASADVAAFDLPGFGESARPQDGSRLSLDCLADRTALVIAALGWTDSVYVVGHSHGGGVAQVLAVKYPSLVSGVVLLATLGSPAHRSYRLLATPGATLAMRAVGALLGPPWLRPLTGTLMSPVFRDIFAPERILPERRAREIEAFAHRPEVLESMVEVALEKPCLQLATGAPEIKAPVLFLHGAADRVVPVECAQAIHRRIQGAGGESTFEVLPGAGHMLLEYQADEVTRRILEFIERSEGHAERLALGQRERSG